MLSISIHAPREGSDQSVFYSSVTTSISIHAPREGSDLEHGGIPLLGGCPISIHAPREGSDGRDIIPGRCINDFNPRSPRGERLG